MKFIFLCLFVSLSAYADQLNLKVSMGDRETKFSLSAKDQKYQMSMQSSELGFHETTIGEKNYLYVKRRVLEIERADGSKTDCPREQAEVNYSFSGNTSHYSVCLAESNERSSALKSLLNVLLLAY